MKPKVYLFLLVLSITANFAYTGFEGGKGLFRVHDARTEEAGLNFALHLLGKKLGDTTKDVSGLLAPAIQFTPIANRYVGMELFATFGGDFRVGTRGVGGEGGIGVTLPTVKSVTLTEPKAGAKISFPYLPVLKVGGRALYQFSEQAGRVVDKITWAGLITLRFQDLVPVAPNLIINYGKSGTNTNYGAGIELATERVALFTELTSEQPGNSKGIFDTDSGIVRITPGLTFGNPRGFALILAYGFGLKKSTGNELILGINIGSSFSRRPSVVLGQLLGRVIEAKTKKPILATVEFPEKPKLKPVVTDSAGLFLIQKIPTGVLKVKVSAPGYRTLETFANIEAKSVGPLEFELYPLINYGVLAGTVTDARNNKPLPALITFADSTLGSISTDPNTGAFRKDNMPVGTYTLTANAEGYFPSTATIQIEENRITNQQFALKPLAVKVILTGAIIDRADNTPVAGKIILRDALTNSLVAEVQNDSSTGVYITELPTGTYVATASAEGYIDQTTALVVEENRSVKQDFALVKVGTAITLKGIYFDFGKATIRLPESQEALQAAYQILKENPTIKVEIQGHTDNIGSAEYNQRLSESRAWAVVNYLIQQMGVDPSRLLAKGYGESQPKASNDTPEGRALNRRVEFVVIGEVQNR